MTHVAHGQPLEYGELFLLLIKHKFNITSKNSKLWSESTSDYVRLNAMDAVIYAMVIND